MKKYAIFGLTGDPCTCAHYEIVNKILTDNLADKVIVIPTIVDYYRLDKERMFTNEQRLEIIKTWFKNCKNVIVDDYEYRLTALTSSLDNGRRYWHMLQDIISRYGKDNEYLTVVGGDSWNNITTWYNFRELGKNTKFIVVSRDNQTINFYINYPELHSQPYKVIEIDKKFNIVSASEVRRHLKEDRIGDHFYVYLEEIEAYLETKKTWNDKIQDEITENKVQKDILIAHTPIFDLVKGPMVEDGFNPVKIKSPDWVTVICELAEDFLMVKQLRHGLNKEFEEFPCGMVEDGELPIVAALRELEEETGMKLKTYDLQYLGKFAANPAFMTNYMHYFYIKPKTYDTIDKKLDEHEHLTSYWIGKKDVFDRFVMSEGSSIMGCALMLLIKHNIL